MKPMHDENHVISRIGWLRAAVLGANDGLLSTASLIIGVAAASSSASAILIAGTAGLVSGAVSMAAGEYVSVSSQHDTELAEMAREKAELDRNPVAELEELTQIYVKRGVTKDIAKKLAKQLTAEDALNAHARDELGITSEMTARPVQAALTSGLTFATGAAIPLLIVFVTPSKFLIYVVSLASLLFLALLGGIGARIGGSSIKYGALRVTFWGAFALALTAGIGAVVGRVV